MAEVGPNVILSWVGELSDLEQKIEDLQGAKRDFYAGIREQHGKPTADGLKTAMRLRRMDGEKRAEADEADEIAAHILAVIEKGPSRAPAQRATREEPAEPVVDTPAPVAVQPAAPLPVDPAEHFTPPAFLVGDLGPLRPHCLKPEACAGVGRNHCYTCTKAAEKEGIAS
jgi:hypothetical protein